MRAAGLQLECLYGQGSVVNEGGGGGAQEGRAGGLGGGGGGGSVKDMNHIWFTGDMGHTCNLNLIL